MNILLISSAFYPDPSVASVRVTSWARDLSNLGCIVTVLHRDYGYRCSDSLMKEKVGSINILRFNSTINKKKFKKSGLLINIFNKTRKLLSAFIDKFQLLVPDPSVKFWTAPYVLEHVFEVVRHYNIDVVVTSSPPHSIHSVGLWLKHQVPNLKWVADFRDPYLLDKRYKPRWIGRLRTFEHSLYEKNIYKYSDLIIHAIPIQHEYALQKYLSDKDKCYHLPNGFPDELLSYISECRENEKVLSVRSVGNIGGPEALLLAQAVMECKEFGLSINLRFTGPVPSTRPQIEALLGCAVTFLGPIRHDLALSEVACADVLVCAVAEERRASGLSSKLFEYLAVGVPVLLINPTTADVNFVVGAKCVSVLDAPTVKDIMEFFRSITTGIFSSDSDFLQNYRQMYNRGQQSKQLYNQILNIL
jgi:glycosyltransferase involved in cell wall biosynthesis